MPDVGVLNLQIHDNSSTAAEGLGRLAAKLKAVKAAVSGVRLTPVVNGINKINEALKKIDESAITKLNQITDALERLGKVTGDVGGIRISFGGRGQSAEEIATSMQAARAAISDANSDFEDFKATVQEVSTQDEELARSVNGVKQSVNQLDFSVFDPAKLPLDALGMKLDDNAKELYQWKSAIKESFESVQQLKSKDLIKSFEEAEAAMKATKDAGEFGKDIVTSTSEATDALKELKEIAAQKWDTNFQQWFDSLEQTIQKLNEKLNAEQSKKRPSERAIAELSATIDTYKKKLADLQDKQTRFTNGTYFAGEAIKKEFADVPTEELGGKIEEVKNRIETMREALGKSDGSDAGTIEKYNSMLDAMSEELEKVQAKWNEFTSHDNTDDGKQVVFQSIEEAAKQLGISTDEVRRKLEETYSKVYENKQGMTLFHSAEEAADALGVSLEDVKKQCQDTYGALYGNGAAGPVGNGDVLSYIEEESETARTLLDMLRDKIAILQNEIDSGKTEKGAILSEKAIVNDEIQVEKLRLQVERLQDRIRAGMSINGADFVNNLGDYTKIDLLTMKLNGMQEALIRDINANNLDSQAIAERAMRILELADKIEKLKAGQEEATEETKKFSDVYEELKEKIQDLNPFSKLLSQFARIAKYRILRTAIKQITDGIREGTENYYYYSQAIGGSFATSMDDAASSLQTFKNSIGAAVAPLANSLIPVLQNVVSWVTTVVNYFNQFFALLNGQSSWSRATAATATAFDDISDSASGASDSVNDLLADWDELNIIQNESSGSGAGSSASDVQDYAEMFEEVFEYDEKIKEIVNFLKDNFDTILSIVEGIGAAILLWKLSKAFGNELSALQTLSLTAGLILAINGIKITTAAGYDIGKNGLNSENLLDAISGILQTSIGGGLVGLAFGGITGGLIGFTVGAFVSLTLLSMNIKDGEKDAMYGEMHLTAEEIQQEVDRLFAFDVNVALKSAQVDHNNIETARENIVDALRNMEADFVTFKIRATPENAATLLASVNQVVETTNTLLKYFGKKISIGFGFNINYSDPEFVQAFSIERLGEAETYITTLGNKIGEILQDGVVSEFEEGLYNELTQKLSNVTKAMALGETSAKFASEVEKGYYGTDWTQADRETLINYAKNYGTQVENTKEAGYLQALDTRTALRGVYDYMVQRNIDEPNTYSDEEIKQAWNDYYNYNMQAAIDDYVNQATAEGKQIYIDNMTAAFKSAVENSKGFNTTAGGSELLSGEEDALASWFKKNLAFNLGWSNGVYGGGDTDAFIDALDIMGESGWNLLTEEMKGKYISAITQAFGLNSDTFSMIKTQLGVPVDDIVAATNWDGLTDEMKNKYITYLSQAYGGREVLEAIYNSGVMGATEMFHIGDYFTNEKTKESFESAVNELWGEASNYFEENPVQMKVEPLVEDEVDIEAVMGSSANNLNWWTAARSSFESIWDSVMANISSTLGLNGTENAGFGGITITNERDDEQDTRNIEEGTRRGTAGMETKQGQTNSYLSLIHSDLATIAAKLGSGLTGTGVSTVGGLVSNAINAFNLVKG